MSGWLPLTLLCAFALASSDAATKAWLQGYGARELVLVRFGVAGLLLLPLVAVWPPGAQPLAFWGWLMVLAPLEIGAMLLYMRAIRDHPLALTLPYLAFTPVLVILTGWLLLGETLSVQGVFGVILVAAGGWLLNAGEAQGGDWRTWLRPFAAILYEPGSRMMLGAALVYSITAVLSKKVMGYTHPLAFGILYFVVLGAVTFLVFALPRPASWTRIWRRPWAVLAVAGLMALMVVTHFLALARVEVAYMIAVKRASLVFGVLYGALCFGERHLGGHLLAVALMLAGVWAILL